MIEETARHAGHLGIARELTDNRTGLGQRYQAGSADTAEVGGAAGVYRFKMS